jgi:hypothetical protein
MVYLKWSKNFFSALYKNFLKVIGKFPERAKSNWTKQNHRIPQPWPKDRVTATRGLGIAGLPKETGGIIIEATRHSFNEQATYVAVIDVY